MIERSAVGRTIARKGCTKLFTHSLRSLQGSSGDEVSTFAGGYGRGGGAVVVVGLSLGELSEGDNETQHEV